MGRSWPERQTQVIVSLAGDIAERRAVWSSERGWRRILEPSQQLSFHEAGHCCVARALGWHVYQASIDPAPELKSDTGAPVNAYACTGPNPRPSSTSAPTAVTCGDRRLVALLCLAHAGGWRAALGCYRALRSAATDLVERNWRDIRLLAYELERCRRLDQDRIAEILGRPVWNSKRSSRAAKGRPEISN
jgi:hypothetical protein